MLQPLDLDGTGRPVNIIVSSISFSCDWTLAYSSLESRLGLLGPHPGLSFLCSQGGPAGLDENLLWAVNVSLLAAHPFSAPVKCKARKKKKKTDVQV